jgi:hypothetical protein
MNAGGRRSVVARIRAAERGGRCWIVWALTGADGFPWPALMTGVWGIGVVMNAWDLYGRRPVTEGLEVLGDGDLLGSWLARTSFG